MSSPQGRETAAARWRKLRFEPVVSAISSPEPRPAASPAGQLSLLEGEDQCLPCNVQIAIDYARGTAVVRRQGDDGGPVVLAHVGGGYVRALSRWRTHLDTRERKQIVKRLCDVFGNVEVIK